MPSIQQDPAVINTTSDFTGPGEISAALGRAIAANVPMESVWIPCGAAKAGSVEVEGPFTTLSLQLLGNNFPSDPGNTYTATLSGASLVLADTVSLDFINPNFTSGIGDKKATYTLGGGETLTTVAAGLAAAINADPDLKAVGITATSAVAVITITYPSIPPNLPATEGWSQTNKPPQNTTVVLFSKTGTGNEAAAIANASSGGTLGAAITTNQIISLATLPRWIKAQFNTLTGGNSAIPVTPWFHGSV